MSAHKCRLGACFNHPRWHVWHGAMYGTWRASAPFLQGGRSFNTHAEAVAYATERARADMLAAVQNGAVR